MTASLGKGAPIDRKQRGRYRRRVFDLVCSGNENVRYELIGELTPVYCPGCGRRAFVTERKGSKQTINQEKP